MKHRILCENCGHELASALVDEVHYVCSICIAKNPGKFKLSNPKIKCRKKHEYKSPWITSLPQQR